MSVRRVAYPGYTALCKTQPLVPCMHPALKPEQIKAAALQGHN